MESESGEPLFMPHATSRRMAINLLDNPVWHALTGPHRAHAISHGKAAHYPRDMAPFSAICEASDKAYADLARDLAPNTEVRLFRPAEEVLPAGWRQVDAFPMLQMVAASAPDRVDASIETLSRVDIPAMMDLVAIARPGPFGPRSIELGRYLGIRYEGRLVAMAGERLLLPGHVELSGICVHPNARGQGHATRLTRVLMADAFARGDVPFLHVRPENKAVELYRRLGFATRCELTVVWRRLA
jgi:predicted GNAT family acetyltransferase